MDWVKLSTNYFLDPSIMRAGEAAEILFARGLAYSGAHETDGFVPSQALSTLTPVRGRSRAQALVREGLWAVVEGGWTITRFNEWQHTREQMDRTRSGGRRRQQAWRDRHTSPVSNGVTNRGGDRTEVEGEVEVEAAAAALELPATIAIFRDKIHSNTALRSLRFDMTRGQSTELEELIEAHGDARLIDEAMRTCRATPPTKVTAFFGTWRELRRPGESPVRLVEPKCEESGHDHENARNCRLCASETLAGER